MRALHLIFRAAALMLALTLPPGAWAALITLQETNGGSASAPSFTANGVTVTLNGGVLASNGGNTFYQSNSGVGGQNPISLSFSTGVSNLLIDVFNGDSSDFFQIEATTQGNPVYISNLQTRTPGLIESAIQSATLTYSGLGSWDFIIDNIRFDIPVVCPEACVQVVPTPGSLPLSLVGLMGLVVLRLRLRLAHRSRPTALDGAAHAAQAA